MRFIERFFTVIALVLIGAMIVVACVAPWRNATLDMFAKKSNIYNDTVAELNTQIEENEELTSQVELLEQTRTQLIQDLATSNADLQTMTGKYNETFNSLIEIDNSVAELSNKYDTWHNNFVPVVCSAMPTSIEQTRTLEDICTSINSNFEKINGQLDALIEEFETIQAENSNLSYQLRLKTNALDEVLSELEELQSNEDSENSIEDKNAQIETLTNEKIALENTIAQLDIDLQNSQANLETIQSQYDRLYDDYLAIQVNYNLKLEEFARQKQTIETLNAQIIDLNSTIATLDSQIIGLQNQIIELENTSTTFERVYKTNYSLLKLENVDLFDFFVLFNNETNEVCNFYSKYMTTTTLYNEMFPNDLATGKYVTGGSVSHVNDTYLLTVTSRIDYSGYETVDDTFELEVCSSNCYYYSLLFSNMDYFPGGAFVFDNGDVIFDFNSQYEISSFTRLEFFENFKYFYTYTGTASVVFEYQP